jgi:hypothetical protein
MNGIAERYAREGLALDPRLVAMLADHPSHCTERRGCGFTQASRFLAECVNAPRSPTDGSDLRIFDSWPIRATGQLALVAQARGWPHGWRALSRAPNLGLDDSDGVLSALIALERRLSTVTEGQSDLGPRHLCSLIQDILGPGIPGPLELPGMPLKPKIGSCSQAEEFFLEIAHGRVRRGGRVNVFVDPSGVAVLLEKIDLGESHSALTLVETTINGVRLPPGSLLAISHRSSATAMGTHAHGDRRLLSDVAEARFLRLTTLCVEPAERRRCFTTQVEAQVRANMLSPLTTTLTDLRGFAAAAAGSAR